MKRWKNVIIFFKINIVFKLLSFLRYTLCLTVLIIYIYQKKNVLVLKQYDIGTMYTFIKYLSIIFISKLYRIWKKNRHFISKNI